MERGPAPDSDCAGPRLTLRSREAPAYRRASHDAGRSRAFRVARSSRYAPASWAMHVTRSRWSVNFSAFGRCGALTMSSRASACSEKALPMPQQGFVAQPLDVDPRTFPGTTVERSEPGGPGSMASMSSGPYRMMLTRGGTAPAGTTNVPGLSQQADVVCGNRWHHFIRRAGHPLDPLHCGIRRAGRR